ncbi:hypothetical protein S40285_10748, partial [Stachybotrys chlorohalonatus IBT 40285]
MDLSP